MVMSRIGAKSFMTQLLLHKTLVHLPVSDIVIKIIYILICEQKKKKKDDRFCKSFILMLLLINYFCVKNVFRPIFHSSLPLNTCLCRLYNVTHQPE